MTSIRSQYCNILVVQLLFLPPLTLEPVIFYSSFFIFSSLQRWQFDCVGQSVLMPEISSNQEIHLSLYDGFYRENESWKSPPARWDQRKSGTSLLYLTASWSHMYQGESLLRQTDNGSKYLKLGRGFRRG